MIDHHLHAVLVSYKRLELTQQTLASFLDTVTIPYTLVIVDNGSPDDVCNWLAQITTTGVQVHFLSKNRFPGFATNRGWEFKPARTTLLQRIDNDTLFLPGWCDEVAEVMEDPTVGQFGLFGDGDGPWAEMPTWPVGGNSIISRKIYDEGLRYVEGPWGTLAIQEDNQLSLDVWERGYRRVFGTRPQIEYLGGGDPAYYAEVNAARGLT